MWLVFGSYFIYTLAAHPGARARGDAETGRSQNWSPVISGSPNPLKIQEKSIFSAQNPSKTYCNLPRAPWKRQRAYWSCRNALWKTLQRPGARARGVRPASKLVPGDFLKRRTVKITEKSIFSAQNPSETLCNLPRALWKLSGKFSGAQAPARAETGRPQNWSPAFFVCIYNDFFDFFNPGESV